ncbi:MAG TPA: imidazoleglycerol-phosphate dehydratase [Bacillus bacterium]|nr:imidazoleglycerol-phosphate dehydratase [Bacillus sp. (in: firmicutes)]
MNEEGVRILTTKRNATFGSKNQSSPELGTNDVMHGVEMESGNNNKGKEYRSKIGSKSKKLHHES